LDNVEIFPQFQTLAMSRFPAQVSVQEALAKLPLPATEKWKHGVFDVEVMQHGTMSTILYAPQVEDFQTQHEQDELYFVVSGTSELVRDGERLRVSAGDALFVPARMPHRFEHFSKDFVTWAVFWGPAGGEKA
jgi:mannose-6-phosphate isomerase-like protein (cupin superfamily)